MADETVSATAVVNAPAEGIFAILADPWEPGHDASDGSLQFGGWVWRYDLAPAGPHDEPVAHIDLPRSALTLLVR